MNNIQICSKDIPLLKLISFNNEYRNIKLRIQYLKWLNNPEIISSIGSKLLLNQNKDELFIEKSFNRFSSSECMGFFIYHIPDSNFIGTTKLDNISIEKGVAWDGIMIGEEKYLGRGLSKYAYQLLLSYGFLKLGLDEIRGGCSQKNKPMIKTFNRIGYTFLNKSKKTDFIGGKMYDHLFFSIKSKTFLLKNQINIEIK